MKILSLNACILVRGVGFTVNDKKEQRLKKMLDLFKPYDIVCIQEVWESLWGKHTAFYNACYNEGWHVAATKVTGLTNTGYVVLSKDLIGEKDWIVFKNSSTWQRLMSNGVLYAKVYTPEPIHVFNTHLHCDTQPCLNSGKVRMKQLRELMDFMRDLIDPDDKWILCGDFNDTPVSYSYKNIKKDLKDSFYMCGNGIGTSFVRMPALRIDYIMHDHSLNSFNYQKKNVVLSDHYQSTSKFKILVVNNSYTQCICF